MSEHQFFEELADRYYRLPEPQQDRLNELLWQLMPFDWTGRTVVDLDAVGDPNIWMEDHLGEPICIFLLEDMTSRAGLLAQDYRAEITEQGYANPSEFCDGADWLDDLAMYQAEFRGFILAWRARGMPLIMRNLDPPTTKS
jgi:hypothetical protein